MFKQHAKWVWSGGLGVLTGALSLHPISQSDAFWHMTLGRSVWRAGARTVPEPAALSGFSDLVRVPEWLFDVLVYAIHQLAGPAGLSILIAVMAAGSAIALCWMLDVLQRDAEPAALAWVSALVMSLLMARMQLRPQLTFFILLPVFIAVSDRYLRTEGQARRFWATGLVGLQVLWAQLHGSFVLGPAVFGLLLLPHLRADWASSRRGLHLVVVFGLLLGLLSSADGVGVVQYVLVHAGGDAARHVGDMPATQWQNLTPLAPYGAAYWLLWLTALTGSGVARRVRPESLGLALLGLALAINSVRFVAVGALLLGPLALQAAHELHRRLPGRSLRFAPAATVGMALIAWSAVVTHNVRGPIGALGLSPGSDPVAAARFLDGLPPGSAVLSTFTTGASIGFWLEGRVRTYVDTRTPLHFDDTEFAVAREVWRTPHALALALDRFEIDAILTERNGSTCWNAPDGWAPVVLEARHTTFAPADQADPFVALAPCGPNFLTENACVDGGRRLDAEIARLATWGESPFLDYLRVERILHCGGELALAEALLPGRRETWSIRKQRALAAAVLASRTGHPERTLDLLETAVRTGDVHSARIVLATLSSSGASPDRVRDMLEDGIHRLADDTPLDLRGSLAMICLQQGDAECVRFHGMRVAVAGEPEPGRVLLRWLRANHPNDAVRSDAERWLASLERREAETMADRIRSQPEAG